MKIGNSYVMTANLTDIQRAGWLNAVHLTVTGREASYVEPAKLAAPKAPVQLLPSLFWGTVPHLVDEGSLVQKGITDVVLLCVNNLFEDQQTTLKVHHVPVFEATIMRDAFPTVEDVITSVNEKGGKTLVCCACGVNKAAAMVIGYLIKNENWLLLDAIEHTRDRCGWIIQVPEYQEQLLDFAASMNRLDPINRWPREDCDSDLDSDIAHSRVDMGMGDSLKNISLL